MDKIALVAAGGAIGATLRYLAVGWIGRLFGRHEFAAAMGLSRAMES